MEIILMGCRQLDDECTLMIAAIGLHSVLSPANLSQLALSYFRDVAKQA
jgi:hypothetical protein